MKKKEVEAMPRKVQKLWSSAVICTILLTVAIFPMYGHGLGHNYGGGGSSGPTVSFAPHDKGHPQNAFKGDKRALDADLYAFKMFLYGVYRFEKFSFIVYMGVKNRNVVPGKNFSLWKDVDDDGKINTAKDELLSEGIVDGTKLVFSKPFTLSSSTSFIVRGDFPSLTPGLVFALNLDKENTVIKNEQNVRATLSFTTTIQAAEHYEPYPLLEMRSTLLGSTVVGKQDITVFVDVSYLRNVEPQWADLYSVRGWTVKGHPVMSEVTGFELLHRRVTLTLLQPPDGLSLNAHTIPEFTLRYRDRSSNQGLLTARTRPLIIQKDLIYVEILVPVRAILIGDPIMYERRLFLDSDYTVPDDYLDELVRSEFWGDFRVSAGRINRVENEGVRIITYRAILSYLGPPVASAILPEGKIPYVKASGGPAELLTYKLPAIEFPFRSIAVGKVFVPPDFWRVLVRKEPNFFGIELGWWMVIIPMGIGGIVVLFLGSREATRLVRWRRAKSTTLLRQIRAWRRIRRFLIESGDTLQAIELSSLIREYVGSVAAQPREFVRSARFSDWFRKRYPEEPELLEMLKRTELSMIREGLGIEITLTQIEREATLRSLAHISTKERIRRCKEVGGSAYVAFKRRFGFGK